MLSLFGFQRPSLTSLSLKSLQTFFPVIPEELILGILFIYSKCLQSESPVVKVMGGYGRGRGSAKPALAKAPCCNLRSTWSKPAHVSDSKTLTGEQCIIVDKNCDFEPPQIHQKSTSSGAWPQTPRTLTPAFGGPLGLDLWPLLETAPPPANAYHFNHCSRQSKCNGQHISHQYPLAEPHSPATVRH